MNFKVLLFKDSNCDLCKVMQQELIDNPPAADVIIIHINIKSCFKEIELYNIDCFPTTIVIDENNTIISRFEGFINSKDIDKIIKEYETKLLV